MRSVSKISMASIIAALITGCATSKLTVIGADELSMLKEKTLSYTKYEKPPSFLASTPVNVQFGILSTPMIIAAGNALIEKNSVADPAGEIAQKLTREAQAIYAVKINDVAAIQSSDGLGEILEDHIESDYVLDVRTGGWGSTYYKSDWNNYRIMYTARARLINVKSKSVVATSACDVTPEYGNTQEAPTYAQLESGIGLKKELARAVDLCVEHLKSMLRLPQVGTPLAESAGP